MAGGGRAARCRRGQFIGLKGEFYSFFHLPGKPFDLCRRRRSAAAASTNWMSGRLSYLLVFPPACLPACLPRGRGFLSSFGQPPSACITTRNKPPLLRLLCRHYSRSVNPEKEGRKEGRRRRILFPFFRFCSSGPGALFSSGSICLSLGSDPRSVRVRSERALLQELDSDNNSQERRGLQCCRAAVASGVGFAICPLRNSFQAVTRTTSLSLSLSL